MGDWTMDDAAIMRRVLKSATWERVIFMCHGYLLADMLAGKASEDVRLGYLKALADISSCQPPEEVKRDEDEDEISPMQEIQP